VCSLFYHPSFFGKKSSPGNYRTGCAGKGAVAVREPLLLHICCAPDEAWVVHTLNDQRDLHCFFCNPNIHPANEYDLRTKEAAEVAQLYGVPFTADTYAPDEWETAIAPFSATSEGGERCRSCFRLRLRKTAARCAELDLRSFTTVMSISPHKSISMLNEEGQRAAQEYGVTYECFDFKKQGGFLKSIALCNELGLYRQDYCGCRLSMRERDDRKRGKQSKSTSPPHNTHH
jgi:predicted adenine nucleotide alpha hydrolase (AANH) superfamily ATPase